MHQAAAAEVEATNRTLERLFQEHAAAALAYSDSAPSVTVR